MGWVSLGCPPATGLSWAVCPAWAVIAQSGLTGVGWAGRSLFSTGFTGCLGLAWAVRLPGSLSAWVWAGLSVFPLGQLGLSVWARLGHNNGLSVWVVWAGLVIGFAMLSGLPVIGYTVQGSLSAVCLSGLSGFLSQSGLTIVQLPLSPLGCLFHSLGWLGCLSVRLGSMSAWAGCPSGFGLSNLGLGSSLLSQFVKASQAGSAVRQFRLLSVCCSSLGSTSLGCLSVRVQLLSAWSGLGSVWAVTIRFSFCLSGSLSGFTRLLGLVWAGSPSACSMACLSSGLAVSHWASLGPSGLSVFTNFIGLNKAVRPSSLPLSGLSAVRLSGSACWVWAVCCFFNWAVWAVRLGSAGLGCRLLGPQ